MRIAEALKRFLMPLESEVSPLGAISSGSDAGDPRYVMRFSRWLGSHPTTTCWRSSSQNK